MTVEDIQLKISLTESKVTYLQVKFFSFLECVFVINIPYLEKHELTITKSWLVGFSLLVE